VDEQALRQLIDGVTAERSSRRDFVRTMAGLGVSAPMAARMLAAAGLAHAQPAAPPFTPTRRGGGGELRILMPDAPTLLNPHFARGLKDYSAARIFYEPLASFDPDGNLVPVLAEEIPTLKNGGLSRDGRSVTWRLKRDVAWHDGKPFTAEDVVFNWEYGMDPAAASTGLGGYEDVARVEGLDPHTAKVTFKAPTPFWPGVFCGLGGQLIPRHVFQAYRGARAREAPANLHPIGTGPYRLVEFKPAETIRAEINPHYHVAHRPYFDRLDVKGGGDSVSAARAVIQTGEYDFAYYLTLEEDVLRRVEQGGKGKALVAFGSGINHIQFNLADPWAEVDGERSSIKSPHPLLSDPAVRTALSLLVDRASLQEQIYGRVGRVTSNFLNAPSRFQSKNTSWEFSIDKASRLLEGAGWKRGGDGVRAKDGRRLKMVFQTVTGAATQKTQAIVKQACGKAGIQMELKAVVPSAYFSGDPANPDTFSRFSADLQMYTTFGGVDPQGLMAQFVSWEVAAKANKWSGRNVTRWRNEEYDRLWRAAETELDPVKRAATFIRMNDLVVQNVVVVPLLWRGVMHAVSSRLAGLEANGWDSIFARLPYWHRRA